MKTTTMVRFWAMQAAIGGGFRLVEGTAPLDALAGYVDTTHAPDMKGIMAAKIAQAIDTKDLPLERDAVPATERKK